MNRAEKISQGVMVRVLEEDPFIIEDFRSHKPLYAALVPDEIFKGSHFERRFVTPFGNVWEKLAKLSAEFGLGYSETHKKITGKIPKERLRRIYEVLARLEHPTDGIKRAKPDWENELAYILEGKGELLPTVVECDVYAEDTTNHKKYAFELKSPLPNSDITKVSKEKLFKLFSMEPKRIIFPFYVLPYNPYGKREDYSWSFPLRWFNMKNDRVVMIGKEFWDFIGGEGTYDLFIQEINKLGRVYRERIYREYLEIEPSTDKLDFKL